MKKILPQDFLKKAREIHGEETYTYPSLLKMTNFSMAAMIEIICPLSGHGSFKKKAGNHIYQKSGCPKCSKERLSKRFRKDFGSFKKEAEQIHGIGTYDYVQAEKHLTNNRTKVPIVCNNGHGTFWQTPDCHLNQKCGCPKCAGNVKISNQEMLMRCKNAHGDLYKYDLSSFGSIHDKIVAFCSIHGKFQQRAVDHWNGHGCFHCGGTTKLTKEKILLKAVEQHGFGTYDYSKIPEEITSNVMKVSIGCKQGHGFFEQTIVGHVTSGYGCPDCAGVKKITKETIIFRANEKHGFGTYDYSKIPEDEKIKNNKMKVLIGCKKKEHGFFEQKINNHLNGQGCPKCFQGKLSKAQQEIYKTIKRYFNYVKLEEPIFAENKIYYADICFPKKKIIIEYNGDYWHANPKTYKQDWIHPKIKITAKEIWLRDSERKKDLEKLGYKVIVVWEMNYKSNKEKTMKQILNNL